MSKSIKLNDDTYVDAKSIIFDNRKTLEQVLVPQIETSDLNNCIDYGLYVFYNGVVANAPVPNGFLLVLRWKGWCTQIVFDPVSYTVYKRHTNTVETLSSFTSWKSITFS